MSNVEDSASLSTKRGDRRGGGGDSFTMGPTGEGDAIVYPSKDICINFIYQKLCKYPAACDKKYDPTVNYTSIFNSWLMSTGYMFTSEQTKNWARCGVRQAYFERTRFIRWNTNEGFVEFNSCGSDANNKFAYNQACWKIFKTVVDQIPRVQMDSDNTQEYNQDCWNELDEKQEWITYCCKEKRKGYFPYIPRVQMETPEKNTEQGDVTQESSKEVNTIITRDAQQAVSDPSGSLDTCSMLSSSEPLHKFESITGRWMQLGMIELTADKKLGQLVKAYYLPEGIYQDDCSPNLNPFETFIYGRLGMEFKIVVNGNKFCVGKIVVSCKYDSYQADVTQEGVQSALNRNHVILDLSTNNEGVLDIPFRYHRPWVRLVKNDKSSIGVRPSKYATVYVHVLSPLNTGVGGVSDVGMRCFFRFKTASFTGMSYRAKVQMFGLEQVVTPKTSSALREVLKGAERAFDQLGRSNNQDKPSKIDVQPIVPRPRFNFPGGKGVMDVAPLRLNPHTLTNYRNISCPSDEPTSFYDLSRIWGLYKSCSWTQTLGEGAEIGSFIVDPTSRSYKDDYEGEPTPLEYACSNYALWNGPIEVRLDFVSNAFHTGSVQISAEFGRKTSSNNSCESGSTYVKVFQLGDQKSVTFTIPFIYDTIMRRTTSNYYNPYGSMGADETLRSKSLSIAPESRTYFKIRVMNPLRPAASAPQSIEILVFIRAGQNFRMHGLKANSNVIEVKSSMDNFPEVYSATIPSNRARREVKGIQKRNEWNEWKPEYLPKTQMDNGDKENQDSTDDFNQGTEALQALTLDNQMNFKDLLRRPTLLMNDIKVSPVNNGGYFIPCQPPSRQMCMVWDGKNFVKNNDWSTTLNQTTTVAIMDMFRAWRGSMRYTFVVKDGTKPIYISYVPHSGVRIIGSHQMVPDASSSINKPIMGSNFITEILCPTVNPTITIETPYDTENTWTLTFDEDPTLNYSWRDKGDFNSGHIIMTTVEKVTMDVWWSAGDDFAIANFYGVPKIKWNGWAYRWNDEHARVQMDFHPKEALTTVTSFTRNLLKPANVGRAALSMVPFIGTPLAVATTVSDFEKKTTSIAGSVQEVCDKYGVLADKCGTTIERITALLEDTIMNVSQNVSGLVKGTQIVMDVLLDLLMAWMEKSWKIVGLAILRVITKLMDVPSQMISLVMNYGTQLAQYFEHSFMINTPQVQVDPVTSNTPVYVGILVGIVGTLMGVHYEAQPQWANRYSFLDRIVARMGSTTGVAYFVQVLHFVKGTFETVKELILKSLGYISPQAEALKQLSVNNASIAHFIREAQIMTSESNAVMLSQPQYKRRFWFTVLRAHQIQQLICRVPANCVSWQLGKLCADVVKASNEKFVDLRAAPVRFEPMVIVLEGAAGVGKSHVTEAIAEQLLKTVGYDEAPTEHIFYRTSGERFWSGYRDQPVVVYDEWLNTTDPTRCYDQIAEMMKIKSTGVFIPEMAHLEDKRIRGNPLIVIICTNKAFPNNLGNYVTCIPATLRRREVVMRVSRIAEFEGVDLHSVVGEDKARIENYEHLQFQIYKDPTKETSIHSSVQNYRYASDWLCKSWKFYHSKEMEQVNKRLERLPGYLAQAAGNTSLVDPFAMFYRLESVIQEDTDAQHNGYTNYEILEQAVQSTINVLAPRDVPIVPVDPPLEWGLSAPDAHSQIDGSSIIAGIFMHGFIPSWIATATLPWLQEQESKLKDVRTTLGSCCICLDDDIPVSYACTSSGVANEQHRLCMSCYRSNAIHNGGRCPVCRHDRILPIFLEEDINHIGIWARLMLVGNRSLQWLCDKFIRYFTWRNDNATLAIFADYLMTVVIGLSLGRNAKEAAQKVTDIGRIMTGQRYADVAWQAWQHYMPSSQIDEWADYTEGEIEPIRQVQALDPVVNPIIVHEWCSKRVMRPCYHGHLARNLSTANIVDGKWRIRDDMTRRYINVQFALCQECYFDGDDSEERYLALCDRYARLKQRELRSLILDYYNDPGLDTASRVPSVFRPEWIQLEVDTGITIDWWTKLTDIWEQYKTTIVYITFVGGVLASLAGLYTLAARLTTTASAVQGYSTVSSEINARNARRQVQRSTGRRHYFQAATAVDTPSVTNVAMGYVAQNYFKLDLRFDGKSKEMYGTGLFNHYMLIPRHYVIEIKKGLINGAELYGNPVLAPQLRRKLNLDANDFILSDDTDLAYFRVPPQFPLFKDIRKFLARDSDFDVPLPSEGILLANPKGAYQGDFLREIDVEIYGLKQDLVVSDTENKQFTVKEVVRYSYSKAGVCGSILFRENHQRPILSMHFAGFGNEVHGDGYGVLLTQEALEVLVEMKIAPVQMADIKYETIENARFVYDDEIKLAYYGTMSKDKVPYIPAKTKLEKSEIHEAKGLTSTCRPAILDRTDKDYKHASSPLFEGVKKHGIVTEDFKQAQIEKAGEALWDLWYNKLKPTVADPRELTDAQCVVGIPGMNYYTPLDLKTSAGYPYNLNTKRTTKENYVTVELGANEQMIGVKDWDPELLQRMEEDRELRKQGIVPHTLFCDTLKDEKRKIDKALSKGGTRVFCSAPFHYTIECRKYFNHFVSAFMTNRHDLMHAVGINPTSYEWSTLTQNLLKRNAKFGTIDYSNFGPGYNTGVAKKAYELIIRWTMEHVKTLTGEDLDETILWTIVYECLNSMHICNNTVYQQGAGSPSGAYFTTIINTMVNQLYLLIAWDNLIPENDELKFLRFYKNVTLYCYGDDAIFSVTEEFEEMFNMQTITEFFKGYSIVATDAAKTGVIPKFQSLSEAQFLKRGFRKHDLEQNVWVAPLLWESIENSTQWIWKSENRKDATYINSAAALIEAHVHGKQIFNNFKAKLNKALKLNKCQMVTGTWEEYNDKFFGCGFESEIDDVILKMMY